MQPDAFRAWTQQLHDNLSADSRVIGLVMLGSSAEINRLPDEWSDHDFFVITQPDVQEDFRQNLNWLPDADQIVLRVRETAHGLKVVFADGHLIEFAIFDGEELQLARVNDYRVLLDHSGGSIEAALRRMAAPEPAAFDTQRHLALFLSLLLVGSGRVARGEILSGQRFIKDFALSHLLQLLAHDLAPQPGARLDNLDPFRRFEQVYPEPAAQIQAALLLEPGAAARSLLATAEKYLSPLPADALAVIQKALLPPEK